MDPEDVMWCDECGEGLPWHHKRRPTARRRLVEPLRAALCAMARPLQRAAQALTDWADKPARDFYNTIQYPAREKAFVERLAREKRERRTSVS